MSGLRILVAGAVLGQPVGGVRRHNQELLPRAQRLLDAQDGGLTVLEGARSCALELPPEIEVVHSMVPPGPPLKRALSEGAALRGALAQARTDGRPFGLVHTGHLPAPRRLGVPFALTLHDLRDLGGSGFRRFLSKAAIADAIGRAAVVICVSEMVREQVKAQFHPQATVLVPNGADHLQLLPRDEHAERFLLHVGHLEARKDLDTLLRAMAEDRSLPELRLVGSPKGDEDSRLRGLARELGVDSRLHLEGYVDDARLAELYAQAACVVIPSRLEGFGIPAVEALRAGAPLALSQAAARPLGLEEGVPCFPTGNPAACARAIHRAMEGRETDPVRVAALLRQSSWDAAAQALVQAWTDCVCS
ncbi:MAG: glycosyltransferase involved in cell wall biosynthesis [Gammaproteobacteria bacterium]